MDTCVNVLVENQLQCLESDSEVTRVSLMPRSVP